MSKCYTGAAGRPIMWDRERTFTELMDDKSRKFFEEVVAKICSFPLSLWDSGNLVIALNHPDGLPAENLTRKGVSDWFTALDCDTGKSDVFATADGVCRCFPVRTNLEIIGALVIGPVDEKILPRILAAGKLLAGVTELVVWTNLKQSMMMEVHGEAMSTSYDDLLRKNRELEESERRYRELAEDLEVQVTRKTAELKKAYVRLLQTEKMASIGQLAAGIAHEINNPLAFVKSNINAAFQGVQEISSVVKALQEIMTLDSVIPDPRFETLRKHVTGDAGQTLNALMKDFDELIPETLEGIARVQRIVADLKEFSHIDDAEVDRIDIHRTLDSTLSVLTHELSPGIEIVRKYGEDLPKINCHPQQIGQILMNLILNAIEAIPDTGKIVIRTSCWGNEINIEIADTGRGIPTENLPRIFDPFFTTKPVGQGTGTGLSICYEVIKAHGGNIEVISKPGVGTAFKITLPVGYAKDADSHV